MCRKLLFLCVSFFITESLFAGNIRTTIEINGVIVNGGLIYVAVYSNENDYKTETAFAKFILQPDKTSLTYSMELPEGEYVVSVFQDTDNDGELKTGLFGMPSEPVGKQTTTSRGRRAA